MGRIVQEFYCGECSGYFRIKLNMALNHGVKVQCPKCGHQHHRYIKNGTIFESGRESNQPVEDLYPPMSSYSKEPLTEVMRKAAETTKTKGWCSGRRDGVPLTEEDSKKAQRDEMMREVWLERFGDRV